MSLLLEPEAAERSSRRNSHVAGSMSSYLRRDRALLVPNRTGDISKATRTIPPVDTFGLGRPIDQDRHGCGSWHKAHCLFSCRGSAEQQIITRETRHEPR